MNPTEVMQHELKCRAQIIRDLQDEKTRVLEMVNRANAACHRLRDETIMVTAQTHAVVKSLMLLRGEQTLHIPGHLLKKARGHILEVGEKVESDDEGSLRFTMRELNDKEKEAEALMRKQVESAEKRITTP